METFEALRNRVVAAGGGTVSQEPSADVSNLAVTLVMHDALPVQARDGFCFLFWLKSKEAHQKDGIPWLEFGRKELAVFAVEGWRDDIDTFDTACIEHTTQGWMTSVSYRFHTAHILIDYINEIEMDDTIRASEEYSPQDPQEVMRTLAQKMHALDEVVTILNTSETVRAVPFDAFWKASEWLDTGASLLPNNDFPEELIVPDDTIRILKFESD